LCWGSAVSELFSRVLLAVKIYLPGLRRSPCGHGCLQGDSAPFDRENTCFYGTGLCWRGQTRWAARRHLRTVKGKLLFCALGLTNVRQETRMRRAKLGVIGARLVQAQLAVDGQPHF